MNTYDSTEDTKAHIARVAYFLGQFCGDLQKRAAVHDASKLEEPEKSAFDSAIPKLKDLQYGSDEYKAALREIKDAVAHHTAHNSHHPEFYGIAGIEGMSLQDIVEMFCDWKAASERMKDGGSIVKSVEIGQTRFMIPYALCMIFLNTAVEMGFIKKEEVPLINPTLDFVWQFENTARVANRIAVEKGHWEEEHGISVLLDCIEKELKEARAAAAAPSVPDFHVPQFTNLEVELADIIIYIMNFAVHHKLNIGAATMAKLAYNMKRPYKHGKQ